MNKWIRNTLIILVVALVSSGLGIYVARMDFFMEKPKEVDTSTIANEMKKIAELATYEYTYTDVVFVKADKKFNGITLPLTKTSFLAKYDGYIKAGVNLQDAEIEVNEELNEITIKVGKSVILENVVDTDSIEVLDEKSSLFNKLETQEKIEEINANKKKMEEKIIAGGFLDKADENTRLLLESTFKMAGFDKVNVVFK
ncbi:MAG: DUF4230 domain-containing protein [Clostridiaceae bacterium]|nr:DUF4230 domain-containing protein [Clostridiaceae bacterium]